MHYLLIYDLADDYLDRRAAFREAHLALAWQAADRGDLLLGGAVAEPADQAYLLFKSDSPAAAEDFANADPYVANGLVKRWHVRQWNSVVGQNCANPVRPCTNSVQP